MRSLVLFISLWLCLLSAHATTYYVAPNGNNNNPGTITAPFASIEKLNSVMSAGDIAYIRGGIYRSNYGNSGWQHWTLNNLHGTSGNLIKIWAYPGENPIFNLDDISPSISDPTAFILSNCSYVHLKGLRITGLSQIATGEGVSRGFDLRNSPNNIIEQIELDHIGGYGYLLSNGSDDNYFLNCDAHHMGDGNTAADPWGNANGFQCTGGSTATRNTFEGCRAWFISDDGFDFFSTDGMNTIKNCWSFWIGYVDNTFTPTGDGNGFKLGPTNSATEVHDSVRRVLTNCIAFENLSNGFDQNGNGNCRYNLYNCTSYHNLGYGYMWGFDPPNPSPVCDFRNNISYQDVVSQRRGAEITGSNNSWNGLVSISNADFLSLSSVGADGARQADGSLPNLSFLKLAPGSDLINAGTNVSLPFNGTAPDMGAFEYSTSTNISPTANAGNDQTITLPISSGTLSGSGTDPDGTIVSYLWTRVSGPTSGTITNTAAAISTITGLIQGVYKFELKVADNSGATAVDTVQVTVNPAPNQLPVANAGADQVITLPIIIANLTGSGSDPDGTITAYSWTKISGPSAGLITSITSAITTVTGLVQGTYKFELKVTDNSGATDTDTMQVIVNLLGNITPVANAGTDQNITLPTNTVSLIGSGSDPDGTISAYSWTKISGPANGTISNASAATTTVTGLGQGVYLFELKVTDNNGATDTDTMQVTVNAAINQIPAASAGGDQNITLPTNTVNLVGTGTDPDGTITAYLWTKLSGPAAGTIANATSGTTAVTGLVQGTYQFELTVTDNNGATNTDIMQVTVNAAPNQAPTANAGADQSITLPANTVALTGSGIDIDGTITAYRWRKIAGPTSFSIISTTSPSTNVTGLVQGVYQFELRVTDNNGATGRDSITITVNAATPPANILPSANAGTDLEITLPTNTVSLSGTGTDPDGTITAYLWTKIAGPANETITDITAAATTVSGLTEGTYQFKLTVTDNDNATATDTVQVIVNPVPNQAPTANAGSNQNITLPVNFVALNGSGTDLDGTITTYLWTQVSGPSAAAITNTTTAATSATGLIQGIYQFELTVTDNDGATNTDMVQVTVTTAPPVVNQVPTANAGPDKIITLPTNSISLNGNGTDTDGNITAYLWRKISGPTAFISGSTTATPFITGLVQGTYKFELKVTDNGGATARDTMQLTVNPAPNQLPTANAGSDKNITLPTSLTSLNGSGTDPDGNITAYLWRKISGPTNGTIINPTFPTTSVTGLTQGVYLFELKVTDNSGATDVDTMQVTVNPAPNQLPTADAGSNQTITLPTNTVTLTGSGTDPDGTIISYAWTKISGPSGETISNPSSATTTVTGLLQGVYQFELKVTDNNGGTGTDIMQVNVNPAPNQLPVANAGSDLNITLPSNAVSLTGSGTDPDGTISGYLWRKISGPTNGTITNTTAASTTATGLVQGIYKFELKVTDNSGATDTDTMQVTVNPAPNQLPVANAGLDQNITLPTNSASLNGSGTDPDGTITAYLWRKISGPTNGTITNSTSATTTVTGLVQGIYKFELKVTDNSGATDLDTMQVTVNPAVNIIPVANAGLDQNITLPTNSVSLNGSGTDPDGTISTYLWRKISGPTNGTITNSTSATTTVTGLVQGIYKFELKVTDNSGATDLDTMQVTVNAATVPPVNQLPTANAGLDQNITLPASSVSLNGSGTDPDGIITAYLWRKISGPANGTITNTASATTTATGLVQGVYKFELKVTDNSGATDLDTMQVTVNAAANQLPVANAGPDQNITLPVSTASLIGSATDPDGIITAYLWRKISGPTNGTITNSAAASTAATGLLQGIYKFELKVTDNSGAIDLDTMQVTVNPAANIAPTANAGPDRTITLPVNSIVITGSGTDPDGIISSYLWTKISGPAVSISNAAASTITVTGLLQGFYKFQLKVTDNSGATDLDTMQVAVNPTPNQLPVANAGLDQNITLPTNSASLTGSGTDPDGNIIAYLWRQISGPANGTITNTAAASTTVTGLVEGVYKFELKVMDNVGGTDVDTMQVTVNATIPVPTNLPPVANAGADTSIYLPDDAITLVGTGTDPDGTIASYSWNIISGAAHVLTNSNDSIAHLSNLQQGIYEFELTVTDNDGATGKDTIRITVGASRLRASDVDNITIIGNPVVNILTARINSYYLNRQVTITIFDIRGEILGRRELMITQHEQLERIDISKFQRGSYFLKINFDPKSAIVKKIIKM